jgi:hypothetical protein
MLFKFLGGTMIRKTIAAFAAIAVGGTLGACSSIVEGTSQEIVINTNPAGASCALHRKDIVIARVAPTPGAATIKKTKYDITILCEKEGYQQASFLDKSGVAGATFGNIILGGAVGWAIDSASGADNKYDSPVNITLLPVGAAPAAAPATAPSPTTAATPAAPASMSKPTS